jgi:HSP20 family protein
MDRIFEESFVRPESWLTVWERGTMGLPIDLYETDEAVVVKATVPGIKPEDLDITVEDGTLTIKGESKGEEKVEQGRYHYQERRYGAFARSVSLPVAVNTDKAEASFEHGVLTLTLPKAEEARPKSIKVKAK